MLLLDQNKLKQFVLSLFSIVFQKSIQKHVFECFVLFFKTREAFCQMIILGLNCKTGNPLWLMFDGYWYAMPA